MFSIVLQHCCFGGGGSKALQGLRRSCLGPILVDEGFSCWACSESRNPDPEPKPLNSDT